MQSANEFKDVEDPIRAAAIYAEAIYELIKYPLLGQFFLAEFSIEGGLMSRIETIKQAIMADPQNKEYTDKGMSHLQLQRQLASISSDRHLTENTRSRHYWKDMR